MTEETNKKEIEIKMTDEERVKAFEDLKITPPDSYYFDKERIRDCTNVEMQDLVRFMFGYILQIVIDMNQLDEDTKKMTERFIENGFLVSMKKEARGAEDGKDGA